MPLRGRRGQHMAEFAIVIGVVTSALMVMVPLVRKALRAGVQGTTEAILGVPGQGPTDTSILVMGVEEWQRTDERGDASFRRTVDTETRSVGQVQRATVKLSPIPDRSER